MNSERGLTLVELLAVVVILSIMVAIASVMIGNLITNAKDRAILVDAETIIAGAKIGMMDDAFGTGNRHLTIRFQSDDPHFEELQRYVEIAEVKWEGYSSIEMHGAENGKITYTLHAPIFKQIKNERYRPNGQEETATLEQVLQVLERDSNE